MSLQIGNSATNTALSLRQREASSKQQATFEQKGAPGLIADTGCSPPPPLGRLAMSSDHIGSRNALVLDMVIARRG